MTSARRPATGAAVLRPELTEAVIDAVFAEFTERGYGRLSMQGVADRAGVGKSALYRRWPGKQDMVIDVVSRLGVPDGDPPSTGSLEGDLRALLTAMRAWLTHPRLRGILPDLIAEAGRSPELGAAFRERLAEPRRAWSAAVLTRAVERGELPTGADDETTLAVVLDVVGSAPYWRAAVGGTEADDAYVDRLARLLAGGLHAL